MNRVAKIIIYALVLFLLYLWINSVAKSCNNRGTTESPTSIAAEDESEYTSDDEIYDEFFESDSENTDETSDVTTEEQEKEEEDEEDDDEAFDEDFSYESKEKKPIAKSATKQVERPVKNVVTPRAQKTSQSSGGKYTVVAGSYLIRDNAEKMVTKLKKMGYTNAAILNFDGSQYHTISAGQFSSYDDAISESSALKNKGIDCYVHTRK